MSQPVPTNEIKVGGYYLTLRGPTIYNGGFDKSWSSACVMHITYRSFAEPSFVEFTCYRCGYKESTNVKMDLNDWILRKATGAEIAKHTTKKEIHTDSIGNRLVVGDIVAGDFDSSNNWHRLFAEVINVDATHIYFDHFTHKNPSTFSKSIDKMKSTSWVRFDKAIGFSGNEERYFLPKDPKDRRPFVCADIYATFSLGYARDLVEDRTHIEVRQKDYKAFHETEYFIEEIRIFKTLASESQIDSPWCIFAYISSEKGCEEVYLKSLPHTFVKNQDDAKHFRSYEEAARSIPVHNSFARINYGS